MKLGLRGKLFGISAVVIVAAGFGCYALLWELVEQTRLARLGSDAERRLELALPSLSGERAVFERGPEGDARLASLARRAGARLTLFDPAGEVLADSLASNEELELLAPTAVPPEVTEVLEGAARGSAARFSSASRRELLYVAAPLGDGAGRQGVLRIGVDRSPDPRTIETLRRVVVVGCLAGLAVAAVLSSLATRLATSGVRGLAVAARRMAGGDLEARARAEGEDDLADLGRSLEQLADGLRTSLGQLVAERDLLSGILEGMREGVLLVDEDGRVALINPALREMLLVADDVVGKLPIELVRDSALHELLEQARRGRGSSVEGEILVGGIKPRRILVRAERLPTAPGGIFVVFYDVTDLRRLESLRRDFVANASHELRTPVTSIRSAAETLASIPPGDAEASARFVGIVSRNAERLQQLVEDLLDLSRIEARELELASEPIELRRVAERVVALLGERAARAGSKLVVALDVNAPSPRGDARALEQILVNLLDNAVKYCPGATVTVRARGEDSRVFVEVADTGPGIASAHLDRLFERFYRVDPGRSRQLGGTGLGLAIVKHLAEAMGGSVSVTSELGRGTTFTVGLPRAELPIAELATPAPGEVHDAS